MNFIHGLTNAFNSELLGQVTAYTIFIGAVVIAYIGVIHILIYLSNKYDW